MYRRFELVRLVRGIPEAGLPPDTVAVILETRTDPEPHYEIEVADAEGRTVYQGSATPDDLAPR